jgi:hypothetical protein
MKDVRRLAAFAAVLTGCATLASVIVMRVAAGPEVPPHAYPNTYGFKSTMLWFELAASVDEVFENLGTPESETGQARRLQLDTANRYDFAFMVCYSLYNAALIYFVTHLNVYRFTELLRLRVFLVLGILLSLAMLVGDVIENQQLLMLTRLRFNDEISAYVVNRLQYWTRVKWGAIFAVCLMLSAGYTAYFRRIPTLLLPAIYAVAGVTGFVSIAIPEGRFLLERVGSPAIALAWTISLIHGAIVLFRGPGMPALTPIADTSKARAATA